MSTLLSTLITGLSLGAIYSLMAIALILVWRSTRVVNFAQAGQAVFSTYIGLEIHRMTGSYWLAILLSIIVGGVLGGLIDLALVRPLLRRAGAGPEAAVAPVIATLGLLAVLQGVVGMFWGGELIKFPSAFSTAGLSIGGGKIPFSAFDLFTVGASLAVMLAFSFIFQRTGLGLSMRAAAFSPEVAQLAGVRTGRVRTIGWSFAGAAGGLAGVLITPTTFLAPNSLDLLLVFGFTAAVVGGLESMIGGALGGLALGFGLAFVLQYAGSSYTFMTAFVVLLAVLLLRPQGLIGKRGGRRV